MFPEAAARAVCLLLLDASVRALVLLLAASGLAALLRRFTAELRSAVWSTALAGILLLPLLARALHPVSVAAPSWVMGRTAVERVQAGRAPASSAASHVDSGSLPAPPGPAVEERSRPELVPAGPRRPAAPLPAGWVLFAGLWLVGLLLSAGRVVLALLRVRRLLQECEAVAGGRLVRLLDRLAGEMRVRRPVSLRLGGGAASTFSPLTVGFLRPAVLLPHGAERWPEERLRAVLLHELAHVRRGDWVRQLLARGVCAVYWFHPAVWWAESPMRLEAERACDERVLRAGVRPSDYAETLLEVTRMLRTEKELPLCTAVTPGGRRGEGRLARRLETVLAHPRPRRPGRLLVAGLGLAGLLLLPLAAVRVTRADDRPGSGTVVEDSRAAEKRAAEQADRERAAEKRAAEQAERIDRLAVEKAARQMAADRAAAKAARRQDEARARAGAGADAELLRAREELLRAREELVRARAEVARARAEAERARMELLRERARLRLSEERRGSDRRRGGLEAAPGDRERAALDAAERELQEQQKARRQQLEELRGTLRERLPHLEIDRRRIREQLELLRQQYEHGALTADAFARAEAELRKAAITQRSVRERLGRVRDQPGADGEALARRDEVLALEAELEKDRAVFEQADQRLARARAQYEAGTITKLELDRMTAEREHAAASLAEVQAQLTRARKRLADSQRTPARR